MFTLGKKRESAESHLKRLWLLLFLFQCYLVTSGKAQRQVGMLGIMAWFICVL